MFTSVVFSLYRIKVNIVKNQDFQCKSKQIKKSKTQVYKNPNPKFSVEIVT